MMKCHASNLDWRLVSCMMFYMFQCHFPRSSHPLPLPQSPGDCSIHQCLFCCLIYRVIVAIFLDSMYMRWYTVLVFFFLAYFTLYDRLQFHPPHYLHFFNWPFFYCVTGLYLLTPRGSLHTKEITLLWSDMKTFLPVSYLFFNFTYNVKH